MNWLLHVLKMYIHCKIPWIILCFTASVSLELHLFCSSFQIIHGFFIHVLYFISVPTIIISSLGFTRLNFFSSSTDQELAHFLSVSCPMNAGLVIHHLARTQHPLAIMKSYFVKLPSLPILLRFWLGWGILGIWLELH